MLLIRAIVRPSSIHGLDTAHAAAGDVEYPLVAAKDIKAGEELTQNYFEFGEGHQM